MSTKCQFCSNKATVHLTDIINKKKREMHLCEACARQKNLIPEPPQELNVTALLELVIGKASASGKTNAEESVCPDCGMVYGQFRSQGRLGCPNDYEAFRSQLVPLLESIHRFYPLKHVGKIPKRQKLWIKKVKKAELEASLKATIASERFEEAAAIRDQLKVMENENESQ